MARQKDNKQYLAMYCILLLLLGIPTYTATKIKSGTIGALAPVWETIATTTEWVGSQSRRLLSLARDTESKLELRLKKLELRNQQLTALVEGLEDQLTQQQLAFRNGSSSNESTNVKPLYNRVSLENSVASRVIFRSEDTWNNVLWIDVGWQDNSSEEEPTVAKDSIVVCGSSVVGIIDHVGRKRSRVRLITDPSLVPAVRVARGKLQNLVMVEEVTHLIDALTGETESGTRIGSSSMLESLEQLRKNLLEQEETQFLAKGELHGAAKGRWKGQTPLLTGSGFNYDFADEHGPARDLRTGKPSTALPNDPPIPLVKPNDLLITTGMDGVFPAGLYVAMVTQVKLLREGAYHYELEARPTAKNFDHLTTLFVLPPVGNEIAVK